ncbi:MAG: cytochrome c [Acidobacteriota bacterium]
MPWKVMVAALALGEDEVSRQAAFARLESFGFLRPRRIANWPGPQPELDRPLGIVAGDVTRSLPPLRVETANLGCAACHAGVTYDAEGLPRPEEVWLGLPNTSIDLEAYTWTVYRSLQRAMEDPDHLLATVERLFPDISLRERKTLRRFVLPRIAARLAELEAGLDAPTVFSNGSPGLTNGVAALKLKLGLLSEGVPAEEFGFTSIPDLGDRPLRSALLWDSAYVRPGVDREAVGERGEPVAEGRAEQAHIVAFFTVPTMGMEPGAVVGAVPGVAAVLESLADYRPPPFPGPIEEMAAVRGGEVYAGHCASCHGEYTVEAGRPVLDRFPNRLVVQGEMGSDPLRWQAMDAELVAAIRRSGYGREIDAATTGGYVATPLTGLWATAPYLHNGSVPTLWHLMHPAERPRRFAVGGHRLDFERVGIALHEAADGEWVYPGGWQPFSTPRIYDTREPGRSNTGHEREFEALPETDKAALLEFLKLL